MVKEWPRGLPPLSMEIRGRMRSIAVSRRSASSKVGERCSQAALPSLREARQALASKGSVRTSSTS